MKYFEIKKEELKYFADMAPVDIMEKTVLKNVYAIGAAERESGLPAGILIFSHDGAAPHSGGAVKGSSDEESLGLPVFTHLWIYVLQDKRGNGIGTGLMHSFFDAVSSFGAYEVRLEIGAGMENFPLKSFYEGFAFDFEDAVKYLVSTDLKHISSLKQLSHYVPRDDIISLEEAEKRGLAFAGLESLQSLSQKNLFPYRRFLEKDVSCIMTGEKGIEGFFLVIRHISGAFEPIELWMGHSNGEHVLFMLRKAVHEAVKRYKADTPLYYTCGSRRTGLLTDHLFPELSPLSCWKGGLIVEAPPER